METNNIDLSKQQAAKPIKKKFKSGGVGLLGAVIYFIFFLYLLFAGWVIFQKFTLEPSLVRSEQKIEEVKQEIEALEKKGVRTATNAQAVLTDIKNTEIQWSRVISRLITITPVNVFYRSYSINSDGSMTVSGIANDYVAVSNLVQILESSDEFEYIFVPSINIGSSSSGGSIATFSLRLQFK